MLSYEDAATACVGAPMCSTYFSKPNMEEYFYKFYWILVINYQLRFHNNTFIFQ